MDDILPGIEPISRLAELRIALRFPGLRIHFDQVDPGIHTLILKRMGERHFRLLLIGVREGKRENIVLVPVIVLRSLHLFHIVAVIQRKIRLIHSTSVCSRGHLFDKGILLHDHCAVRSLNICPGIKAVDAAGKRILCGVILLDDSNLSLLAVIFNGHASKDHFPGQVGERQCNILAFPVQDKVLRSTCFLHGIGSEEQVVEGNAAVIAGHQTVLYQVAFLVDHPAACRFDLRTGIDRKRRAFLFPYFILKGRSGIHHIRTDQHLAFLVDRQLSADLLVLKSMGEGDRSLLVIGIGCGKAIGIAAIQLITGRSRQLFHIELIAQWKICCKFPFSVCSGCHFPDQRIFLYDDRAGIVLDLRVGIQAVNRTADRGLRQLILLQSIDFHLLAVIGECCRAYNGLRAVAAFGQGHRLALALIHVVGRRTCLRDHIGSERQVVQDSLSVLIGCESCNRSPLLIDNRSVSRRNIRTGRYRVLRTGKLCRLVLEGRTVVVGGRAGQHLTFLIHLQSSEDLVVRNSLRGGCSRRYRHSF